MKISKEPMPENIRKQYIIRVIVGIVLLIVSIVAFTKISSEYNQHNQELNEIYKK